VPESSKAGAILIPKSSLFYCLTATSSAQRAKSSDLLIPDLLYL